MTSLEEAWRWYQKTREHLRHHNRLVSKHWDNLPWDGPLGRDEWLREVDPKQADRDVRFSLEHLDDIAVFMLFAAFEATVRMEALSELHGELGRISNPLIRQIVTESRRGVKTGPFLRVLAAYKGRDHDLVEQVNQVRKYRNWIAHGRRGAPPSKVTPSTAFERLTRFLDAVIAPRPTDAESSS